MTLTRFKQLVEEACIRAGETADHAQVEVWLGKKGPYDIVGVSQFSVVPDLVISAGVEYDKENSH